MEKQLYYLTQENLELKDEVRRGQEAEERLEKNKEKLKEIMMRYLEEEENNGRVSWSLEN